MTASMGQSELLDEARLLGLDVDAEVLRDLSQRGLLPAARDGWSALSPVILVTLMLGDMERAERDATTLVAAALDPAPARRAAARDVLERVIERLSVLGDLGTSLALFSDGALSTMRGAARVEWRLRQALAAWQDAPSARPARTSRHEATTVVSQTLPDPEAMRASQATLPAPDPGSSQPLDRSTSRLPRMQPPRDANETIPDHRTTSEYHVAEAPKVPWSELGEDVRAAQVDSAARAGEVTGLYEALSDAGIDAGEAIAHTVAQAEALSTTALHTLIETAHDDRVYRAAVLEMARREPDSADVAQMLSDAIASRRHDERIVDEAVRVLESRGHIGELLDLLRQAADEAPDAAASRSYLRLMADIALRHLDCPEHAVTLLADGVAESGGDRDLLDRLVQLARALDEADAERRALQSLIDATPAVSSADRHELARLLRLHVDVGDVAAFTALLERMIADEGFDMSGAADLDVVVDDGVGAGAPVTLGVAWLKRRTSSVDSASEAFRMWRAVVDRQEAAGIDAAEMLISVDMALTWAHESGVDAVETARLHDLASRLGRRTHHFDSAAYHAVRAAPPDEDRKALQRRLARLVDFEGDAQERERMADALRAAVFARGDAEIIEAFAAAARDVGLWSQTAAALERVAAMLPDDAPQPRRAALIADIASAYEAINSSAGRT